MLVIKSKKFLESDAKLKIAREVPMLGRSIDLVIKRGRTIISIEFKLHDWKKGLSQAKDYLLASDYAYICLPQKKKVSGVLIANAKALGIGVFLFCPKKNWPFTEVVPAKKSDKTWKFARSEINKSMRDGSIQRTL